MQKNKDASTAHKSRLREITAVLKKHGITRGLTPEKVRLILEDLGPTFIKIGQIMSMHSDILPKRYCDELMRLCYDVAPMPFKEVTEVIEAAYGCPFFDVFSEIDEKPLGSASIAQVHRAMLLDGSRVVVKVQRKDIYETMARDIALLHKAVKLVPPVSIKGMVDLDMVLDELWAVTREEMNFLTEAANMEEFAKNNQDVAYVDVPKIYQEYTTMHVLVMEYVDGCEISDKEYLTENGYDLKEIGSKLVDNYIKQVMDDGFFHADPHPGNVKIRDGKIVWMNMRMMGRLTDRDRGLIGHAIQEYTESLGYGVVREYIGHGVGKDLHEDPEVPNFGNPGRGMRLVPGMTLAIEPMINLSGAGVRQLADGWTVVTKSGSISAHFEHTVLITETGVKILTVH